jgi:hypothetical protein
MADFVRTLPIRKVARLGGLYMTVRKLPHAPAP